MAFYRQTSYIKEIQVYLSEKEHKFGVPLKFCSLARETSECRRETGTERKAGREEVLK